MEQVLSVAEAAEHLGVSERKLNDLRRSGRGPCYYQIGRAVHYQLSDLEKYLKQCRVTTKKGGRA